MPGPWMRCGIGSAAAASCCGLVDLAGLAACAAARRRGAACARSRWPTGLSRDGERGNPAINAASASVSSPTLLVEIDLGSGADPVSALPEEDAVQVQGEDFLLA